MTLPDIRKVPLSIPLPAVCNIGKDMESVKKQLDRLNMALCKARPSWRHAPTMLAASESLTAEIRRATETLLTADEHANPLIERYREDASPCIEYGTYYNFFSKEADKPITAITLEPQLVYSLNGDFIKGIKQHRPALYPLMRLIVTFVAGLPYVTTVTEISSIMKEWTDDNIYESEDDETRESAKERLKMIGEELSEYKAHVKGANLTLDIISRRIRQLHKRLSHLMSIDENLFVITAIALTEAATKWDPRLTAATDYDDYYDCGSRHDISSFFYLIWGDRGMSSEYIEDFLNGSGELSAPQVILQIKDRKGLESAVQAVRFFVLLQTLMASGNQIWT